MVRQMIKMYSRARFYQVTFRDLLYCMPVSTPCLLEDLSVKYYHFINTCISFYPTVKLQTHLPKANIQYCGYFDVPWKKSENMQIHEYLTIVCAMWSSLLSKLFQTSLSYTIYNNKAQIPYNLVIFYVKEKNTKTVHKCTMLRPPQGFWGTGEQGHVLQGNEGRWI